MSLLSCKVVLNNNVKVPSRLVVAPLTLSSSNPDGTISDEEREYLKTRGTGIGLYILGATAVSQEGITFLSQPRALSKKDIPSLSERAKIIQSQGAKAINQIHHGGLYAKKEHSGVNPVGPSIDISNEEFEKRKLDPSIIHELTDNEIKKIIEDFAYATELSLKSGFDGVEIHGANNFILQQFYSAYTNHRSDDWGGNDEKRMNFLIKIVDAVCKVRDKYNHPDFIIGYRLSPEEPYENGLTMNETIKLIKVLVTKPIQYIHISQNNYFQTVHRGEGEGQERLKVIHNLTVGKVSLIGVGGLRSEEDFEIAAYSGFSEFIATGIASILNKDLGILLKEGKGDKIKLELDPEHPENDSIPKNLFNKCITNKKWNIKIKGKNNN